MDVELRGEFPAKFRLDVTEPPPADALSSLPDADPSVRFAAGKLVVVERGHPLRVPRLTEELVDYEGNDDGTRYTQTLRKCTPDGECLSRRLRCQREACELRAKTPGFSEDVAMEASSRSTSAIGCHVGYCATQNTYCTSDEACESEYRSCNTEGLGRYDSASSAGEISRCEVISEEGELALERYERVEEAALGYLVLYFSRPTEFGELGWLGRGYHLVKTVGLGADALIAQLQCSVEARISAVRDYNREHGTALILGGFADSDAQAAIDAAAEELEAQCPPWLEAEVIADPLAESFTFTLGRDFGSER